MNRYQRVNPSLTRATVAFLTVFALLAAAAGPPQAAATNLDARVASLLLRLETQMAGVKTVQTAFRQEKELAILAQKLVIEGRLALENPGRLAWRVEKPIRYALVMSDTEVSQWDETTGGVQRTPVGSNPILQVVSEQLRKWFSGRYTSLAGQYVVRIAQEQPIILEFVPTAGSPEAKALKRVTVTFREDERYLRAITIEEAGGDKTTMNFSDTALNAPIDGSNWQVKRKE